MAGLTAEEAKRQLIQDLDSQARLEAAGLAKRLLEEAKENADREAREIIASSIQRVTRDYVNEATISVVPIANDAMKGRICLLYTSDAADERSSVDLGGRRIIKKKKTSTITDTTRSKQTNKTREPNKIAVTT